MRSIRSLSFLSVVLVAIFIIVCVLGCQLEEPTFQVKGVVEDVSFIAQGSSFNASDIKNTIVKFDDGRVKAFYGISEFVFQRGKMNIITYNQLGIIKSVEIK